MYESKGKPRRAGWSTVSSQHQITLGVKALRDAGIRPGDRVQVSAAGPGRLTVVAEGAAADPLAAHSGILPGIYGPGYLDDLRGEWA